MTKDLIDDCLVYDCAVAALSVLEHGPVSARFDRSASQESLEDQEEHLLEPMETMVRNSPRNRTHKTFAETGGSTGKRNSKKTGSGVRIGTSNSSPNGHSSVEFWSKSSRRRRRRTSVSGLCPYPDLLDMTRHLRNNITVGSKRRVLFGVKHKEVFNGKVATNFLKYICQNQDDPEAARDVGT